MNKKTLIIPTLILAAGVAAMGFSTQASAAGFNLGGTLGFGGGSNSANVSVRADANDANSGQSSGQSGMMQHGRMPGVFGTVTAINGDTITVQSKGWGQNTTTTSYTVNATGATVMKAGATSSVSSIAVGDTIMVQGTVSGSTVTATKINDGVMTGTHKPENNNGGATIPNGNGQPIIGGTVTAVNGNTITITNKSNTSYTIDVTSATITKNGATSTASSVAVGDSVLAQGTVNGTSVTAVSLTDSANATGSTSTTAHGFFGMIGAFFAKLF